jgi:hypothetical protein
MFKLVTVTPVLLVILSIIEFGEAKDPEVKKPKALSVAEAVTPLAKL